jgi:hypothetical protein
MPIEQFKKVGMMQNTFMFHISIPVIPNLGVNTLQFTIRSSTIPAYTRNKNLLRYLNNQITLPGGKEHDGEWSVTSLISESYDDYNKLVKWFYDVDTYAVRTNVDQIKADAYVKLLALNENEVTHRFKLIGLYPLNIPEFSDINMENADGFITSDFNFAYDYIDYDYENKLKF